MGLQLTAGDARAERAVVLAGAPHRPRMAEITAETCRAFGVPVDLVMGHSRRATTVLARHAAMFLACRLSGRSLTEIGRFFDRHHSSVIHARDVTEMHVDENPDFAACVARIEAALITPQQEQGA